MVSRRGYLATLSAVGVSAVAGCSGFGLQGSGAVENGKTIPNDGQDMFLPLTELPSAEAGEWEVKNETSTGQTNVRTVFVRAGSDDDYRRFVNMLLYVFDSRETAQSRLEPVVSENERTSDVSAESIDVGDESVFFATPENGESNLFIRENNVLLEIIGMVGRDGADELVTEIGRKQTARLGERYG